MGRAKQQADHHHQVVLLAGDDPRQVLVLVVIAVEERQLLLAMRGIVEHVDVEGQVPRGRGERGDELVDENVLQSPQRADVDGVLEAGQGGLAGQFPAFGRTAGEEFEERIVAEHVVVVLVGVVGQDAVDPHADHFQKGMRARLGVAGVVEGGGKLSGQAELLVQLPDRQQPRVAGQLSLLRLDDNGLTIEEIERHLPIRLYNHPWASLERTSCFCSTT